MLRKFTAILTIAMAACTLTVQAEDTKKEAPKQYVKATDLRIINKGFDDTERTYSRLPIWLKDSVRPDLWNRQQCSTGIGVRFATNSSTIGVRYDLFWNTHMIHMADTGLKGTDLYILEGDSVWRHVNTNRPYIKKGTDKTCEFTYVEHLSPDMKEFMVYLPLYDGITDLDIVVDSGATITAGNPEIIDKNKKVIAYGTSILQGGCASRTGMCATNIMSRDLNCEIVNLAFSGEGKMDYCMARAMAQIPDVDLYFLDPVPNCTEMMCDTLTYDFVKILVEARPEVPIVMLEGPMYPYSRYDPSFGNYLPRKNEALRRNFERVKKDYPNAKLYYITADKLDRAYNDGTVDGIHLTDLGFVEYAEEITPILREILYPNGQTVKY
ncbi:MAG: SGNH/GDSL hydrolase family protein [Muribaculaceae bacterium]|nr:SGNH/GDSL hydrolase family protein [Muribaculaceae bacterium]